ncbi:putative transcription factor interactor and regulator CCHC(Zn) family [Helianthus anomalus]
MKEAGLPPGGFKSANPKKCGVKIKGFRNCNRSRPVVKYSPALADLRIKGFVEETQRITAKAKKGPLRWADVIEAETNSLGVDVLIDESDVEETLCETEVANMAEDGSITEQVVADVIGQTRPNPRDDAAVPDNISAAFATQEVSSTQVLSPELNRMQSVDGNGFLVMGKGSEEIARQNIYGLQTTKADGMPSAVAENGNSLPSNGTTAPAANVWDKHKNAGSSYAEQIKCNQAENKVHLEYIPPVITPKGKCRVILTEEDMAFSAKVFPLYLYGYFLGTSMDFNKVNLSLRRLWKAFDISDISKGSNGFYYFKFSSEEGLNGVLENGPWLINNIPILLNRWEPGICIESIEPNIIPLWVTVHKVPMELWTGRGMSKIFSGIGTPLLMDRVTQNRVENHTGKLGFARMLVNAKAELKLPNEVEVEFPSGPNRPGRVGKLEVTYQWKPAVCDHCVVFGHSTKQCKHRPRTVEETVAEAAKATKQQPPVSNSRGSDPQNDEFTTVRCKGGNPIQKSKGKDPMVPSNGRLQQEKVIPKFQSGGIVSSHGTAKPAKSGKSSGGIKGNPGFNFQRAVQGASTSKSQPKTQQNTANQPSVTVSNRFSVLNFAESVRHNDLVGEPMDLFPQANVNAEKCTLNEEHSFDPGRVLPRWCSERPNHDTNKDYGITDAQKKRILDALSGDSNAVRAEDQEDWVEGEYDFFYDKCFELGLDPDFSVEDVYEDESGAAQFLSQLSKTGKYFDPVVAKPPLRK